MNRQSTFTHFRVVAPVSPVVRERIAGARLDLPPIGAWPTPLEVPIDEIDADLIDVQFLTARFRRAGAATDPIQAALTGPIALIRGGQARIGVGVVTDPPIDRIRRIARVSPTVIRGAIDRRPRPGLPALTLVDDLDPDDLAPVRSLLADRLAGVAWPIDRLRLLGTAGRSDWWTELATVSLGARTAPANLDRPPLIRHGQGWRVAAGE